MKDEKKRKQRGAIGRELDDLRASNQYYLDDKKSSRRNGNEHVTLNTFDYDSDEESKIAKEEDFTALLQISDKILYNKLSKLLDANVLESLKNNRKTMKSTLISEDIAKLAHNYGLTDKLVTEIRELEISTLLMAKRVATTANILKYTDIQKKLEKAKKLHGKSGKRRLIAEDDIEENQEEKAHKKHSKKDPVKNSQAQVLSSLAKGQLKKSEYTFTLEQIKELLNLSDTKDNLVINLEIAIAIKDASSYPLNLEKTKIDYEALFGVVQQLHEDNLTDIEIMLEGLENSKTASTCVRLNVVLQKYRHLLSTTAATATTASIATTTPTVTTSTTAATNVSTTTTGTSTVTATTPLSPQSIALSDQPENQGPVDINTELFPFQSDLSSQSAMLALAEAVAALQNYPDDVLSTNDETSGPMNG